MKNKNNWSGFLPTNKPKTRSKPRHLESDLQIRCVSWFRLFYSDLMLFSVPNGGQRDAISAKFLKMEGVVAGVADLCLLLPNHGFHALFIEMKAGDNGRQSDAQKAFQIYCGRYGYKYVICRDFDQFKNEIRTYLTITK